jgi:hypothetical protein
VLHFLLHFFFSFLHVDLEFRNRVLLVVTLKEGKGGKNRKKKKEKETEKERRKNGHNQHPPARHEG